MTEYQRTGLDIMNFDCPILDIGNRVGGTGYIDFIDNDEFSEPVNKGKDIHGRLFISFRTMIEYKDGNKKETFMTLFQRYTGYKRLWVGAGKRRDKILMDTTGGADLDQLKLIYKLLHEKSVDIIDDMASKCRILKYINDVFSEINIDENPPTKIYLVSNDKVKVMKDLSEKVNPNSCNEGLSKLNDAIQKGDPSILLEPMIKGAEEFEEKMGRPMTYQEMRGMWG